MSALLVAVAVAFTPATDPPPVAHSAHRGCNTRACVLRVERRHWRHAQHELAPATRAMLARLRGCETRGIPFPANYEIGPGKPRFNGHYGAYQYSWGRGSAGVRAGFRVRPDHASPAEQDVRTAAFFPSHRAEWSCHA